MRCADTVWFQRLWTFFDRLDFENASSENGQRSGDMYHPNDNKDANLLSLDANHSLYEDL